jgi:hypothetical protein
MVTAAATRIGDLGVDVRISWIWAFVKQRHNAHDHARLAIATLWYVEIDPGELHGMHPVRRQAFDGGNRLTDRGRNRNTAGANRSVVDVQSAGPALRNATAEFSAREPKLIADHPEQGSFRCYVDRMANSIHRKLYCHGVPSLIDCFLTASPR